MANQPPPGPPPPPHTLGPPVNFKAAGKDQQQQQMNLIQARNSFAFPLLRELLADALTKRSDLILLDYTREAMAARFQVDGMWHNLPPRDRPSGDAMLVVLKKLADLNVNERRARQEGSFAIELMGAKYDGTLTAQGVPTGERVTLKIAGKKTGLDTLEALGMRPPMIEQLKSVLNGHDGALVIVSGMPRDGLTTTWTAVQRAADRFMRDFIGLEDATKRTPHVENIEMVTFDPAKGETPEKMLRSMLLKQPEAFVVPDLVNGETAKIMCEQAADENHLVLTHLNARDPAEALLRVLALKPPADKFARAVKLVLFQRLVRRLCDACKQAYQPHPQLLQKLGIPPSEVQSLFREWQPPPPEQLVDEKGQPIIPPICPDCGGLGYRGRTAIFEMLVIDDKIRQALIKKPQLETLRQVAREAGNITLREEGILLVAKGATSLSELQRVLKQ